MKNESSCIRNKDVTVKKYLNEMKPCLRETIINFQKSDTWEIQLTIAINFISSKDVKEEHAVHSKSNIIDIMPYDTVNEVIDTRFESLLLKYRIGLET